MKKLIASLIIIAGAVLGFSQEKDFTRDKINLSTYALIQSRKSGGGVGFSFLCFQKGSFIIRDEINLNLYLSNPSLTNASLLTLGDKLIFGSLKEINGFKFRSYGYCKAEFGPSWNKNNSIFTQAPMILELGGAGGFEFIFSQNKSFFTEFGGGAATKSFGSTGIEEFAGGTFKGGYVCLTTGTKYYF